MFLRETIVYDCLSYVFNPVFKQIVAASQKVTYIYSASGGKLATNANGSLTYYRSVMVYGNDNKLLYILTPEGTVTRNEGSSGTIYTYNYFKRDQVGSTRAVLSAVGTTLQNVQSTDYYPFGLAHSTNNLNKNKYLFSGKELQDGTVNNQMLGLYDFGMRQYDAIIGRWTTQDPARQYFSAYIYCGNNPVGKIDLVGLTASPDDTMHGPPIGPVTVEGQRPGHYPPGFYVPDYIWKGLIGGNGGPGDYNGPYDPNTNPKDLGGGGTSNTAKTAQEIARKQRQMLTKRLYEFMRKYFPDYKFSNKIQLYYDPLLYPTRKAQGFTSSALTANGQYLVRISAESTATTFDLFMTMGHELIHVAHFITVPQKNEIPSDHYTAFSEVGTYGWNILILRQDNPNADLKGYGTQFDRFKSQVDSYRHIYPSSMQTPYTRYESWGIPTRFPTR